MVKNIIIGIVFIILGIIITIFTYKKPDSQLKTADLKGYIGGIGSIIIGIMSMLGKLHW